MTYTTIRYATDGAVATIALARPDKLNAFTSTVHAELRVALDAVEQDERIRALVLTGEGRAFSSGQDLGEERLGVGAVVGAGRLHERDRPRQRASVAVDHQARQLAHSAHAREGTRRGVRRGGAG